jgi:hypothetical protein
MSGNSEEKFDAVVGEALTNWYSVESALCCIFEFYVTRRSAADGPTVAAEAFWSLEGFGARLRMTEAVVSYAEQDSTAIDEWASLVTRMRKTAAQRNSLAHGSKGLVQSVGKGSRFVLLRRQTAGLRERSNVLEIHDIVRFGENFGELGADLMVYWHRRQGLPDFERFIQEAREHRQANPHLKLPGGRSYTVLIEGAHVQQNDQGEDHD